MKANLKLATIVCGVMLLSKGVCAQAPGSSSAGGESLTRSLKPNYTLVYEVRPVSIAYSENGKPKFPTDPIYDDKQGYTFTASARGDKLLFASSQKEGKQNLQLIYDGARWYSYWSRDNRMKVMPDDLISEGFFIGRMPMLWPGTGWPRLPFVQSSPNVAADGTTVQVADPHLASGMKPGLVSSTGYITTQTAQGSTALATIAIPYFKDKGDTTPKESWEFSEYTRFQGMPIASRIVWKTYKDPINNPHNHFDVPYFTYEAKLISARETPLEEARFDPFRLIHGIETGNKATPVDWVRNRETVTFYYDPKIGDLESNLRLQLSSTRGAQGFLPSLTALMTVALLSVGGWFAYRRATQGNTA